MGVTPTFYTAEFLSGLLIDTPLPLESVSLSSSLAPGRFSATLDCRKLGVSMTETRKIVEWMKHTRTSLVPVRETPPRPDGTPTATALGEWLIEDITDNPPGPFVQLSGIELPGYARRRTVAGPWVGSDRDPVSAARQMWQALATTDQDLQIIAGSWTSGQQTSMDFRTHTITYWDALEELTQNEQAPFEWTFRTGLNFEWFAPHSVRRLLDIGQPVLSTDRTDITLEVAAPGSRGSLLSTRRTWAESSNVSHVWGFGAGSGEKQVTASSIMWRAHGEPARDGVVSVPTALTAHRLKRHTNAMSDRLRPERQAFTAVMPADVHTPRIGDVMEWRNDETWTRPAAEGLVRCVGWSWTSGQDLDAYELDLVEVDDV